MTIEINGTTGVSGVDGSAGTPALQGTDTNTGISFGTDEVAINTGGTERVKVDSSGNVGIGSNAPTAQLHVRDSANYNFTVAAGNSSTGMQIGNYEATDGYNPLTLRGSQYLFISTGGNERARIDSSGRLLVGTSSVTDINPKFVVEGRGVTGAEPAQVHLRRSEAAAGITSGENIGFIVFTDNTDKQFAVIGCAADADAGSGDYPGRLTFSTTANGASSPTERMRIGNDGGIYIGKTSGAMATKGIAFEPYATTRVTTDSTGADQVCLYLNRQSSDGALLKFFQANTEEGNISVSGTTVSYNGAHLSRWSQLPSGAERTEILRGSVLSNIDEMCEWGEEDNEQLNRMKVSDVEGDRNVAGVFQAWDDDDDTYTNDFYCAMTGDFVIRIAQGVTVERGDLLMSAGDGTAKPQDDDIVRSKTIAKVTSTNVSCTYDDGSYCVPCVLMAC